MRSTRALTAGTLAVVGLLGLAADAGCGDARSAQVAPPTVTLKANPSRVSAAGSSTLVWTSRRATSCAASGDWHGRKAARGKYMVAEITKAKLFKLTCRGAGGRRSAIATVAVRGKTGPLFPLTVNTRHLIDHNGKPFLINGDAAWSLIVELDNAGTRRYLTDRQARGFNAVLVNLVEHHFDTHGAPKNASGEAPFSTAGDFSTPNPTYFADAAAMIRAALNKNIEVFLFPAYLGYGGGDEGWYLDILHNGMQKMLAYGRFVGTYFRRFPNIVWVMGGDYTPNAARSEIHALVQGIEQTSAQPLFTVHNARYQSGVTQYPGESWIDLNTTYSDCTSTPQTLSADYNRVGPIPFFLIEGKYENEGASAACLRSQAYWSVLEGATGEFFGNNPTWGFSAGWQNALDSAGARSMTWFGRLFHSRAWATLVPDSSHTVLTGGYGDIGSASFAAAARTASGSTVIVYTPDQRSLMIDMTKISGSRAKAWWYNPASGQATLIGRYATTGSRSFTPTSSGDWVLVVDDASLGLGAPGS